MPLIVRQGMTLVGLGALFGVVGAVLASRAIRAMLFGISRFDPLTYFIAILILAAVAALACVIPAWHASRIDPMVALRYE